MHPLGGGAGDADIVCLLVDAQRGADEEVDTILKGMRENPRRRYTLILNKVDLVQPEKLLKLSKHLNEAVSFQQTFMISAQKGSGCDDLMSYLASELPEGPWLYPEDQMSDLPMRQLAAEITREKIFERLHQELPYATTVETEAWKELKDGSARVEQTIYVQRDSQKKIVLGKGGQAIKAISAASRRELMDIVEHPVHLFLFVKVREKWVDDPERYREMGLDFHD